MRYFIILLFLYTSLLLPVEYVLGEEATEEIKFAPVPPPEKKQADLRSFTEIFGADLSLTVSLDDVIILVILVNVFALFRKPRLILATSYLFALKWVFWSNYNELLKQSSALTQTSAIIFAICGVLTAILFCVDRFNSGD